MDKMRICAEIDISAIKHNIDLMYSKLSDDMKLYMVIKADGYGHGALPIAEAFEEDERVEGFAVATVSEGIELREGGIKKDILILGVTFPDSHKEVVDHNIIPTIADVQNAESYNRIGQNMGKSIRVHIKIDSGMGRIGFRPDEDGLADIRKICDMEWLSVDGIFTHFARADETDKTATKTQYDRFIRVIRELEKAGCYIPNKHAANSAAILSFPTEELNIARAGIVIYGLLPSEEVGGDEDLRPALSLYSHIVFIKEVSAGTPISYGGTYVADSDRLVATIPVGYADGYPRSLSNKGEVLIRGQRAKVLGRVCMDQMMVDVTDIPGVTFGDRVVIIGQDGNERITAEELGELSGRFNYELVCDLNKRIPRIYVK